MAVEPNNPNEDDEGELNQNLSALERFRRRFKATQYKPKHHVLPKRYKHQAPGFSFSRRRQKVASATSAPAPSPTPPESEEANSGLDSGLDDTRLWSFANQYNPHFTASLNDANSSVNQLRGNIFKNSPLGATGGLTQRLSQAASPFNSLPRPGSNGGLGMASFNAVGSGAATMNQPWFQKMGDTFEDMKDLLEKILEQLRHPLKDTLPRITGSKDAAGKPEGLLEKLGELLSALVLPALLLLAAGLQKYGPQVNAALGAIGSAAEKLAERLGKIEFKFPEFKLPEFKIPNPIQAIKDALGGHKPVSLMASATTDLQSLAAKGGMHSPEFVDKLREYVSQGLDAKDLLAKVIKPTKAGAAATAATAASSPAIQAGESALSIGAKSAVGAASKLLAYPFQKLWGLGSIFTASQVGGSIVKANTKDKGHPQEQINDYLQASADFLHGGGITSAEGLSHLPFGLGVPFKAGRAILDRIPGLGKITGGAGELSKTGRGMFLTQAIGDEAQSVVDDRRYMAKHHEDASAFMKDKSEEAKNLKLKTLPFVPMGENITSLMDKVKIPGSKGQMSLADSLALESGNPNSIASRVQQHSREQEIPTSQKAPAAGTQKPGVVQNIFQFTGSVSVKTKEEAQDLITKALKALESDRKTLQHATEQWTNFSPQQFMPQF